VSLSSFGINKNIYYGLYRYSNQAYLQAHILNFLAAKLSKEWKESIILPLDTDEFLPRHVAAKIVTGDKAIGHLLWQLVWPANLFQTVMDSQQSAPSQKISLPEPSCSEVLPPLTVFAANYEFGGFKHFCSAKVVRSGYRWSQGAHVTYNFLGMQNSSEVVGSLVHMPIQSWSQIVRKFELGDHVHNISILNKLNGDGERIAGGHWSLEDLKTLNKNEFLEKSLGKYFNGNTRDSKLIGWNSLLQISEGEES